MKKFAVLFLLFVIGLAVELPAVAQSKKSAKEIAKAKKQEEDASAKHKSMDLEGLVQRDGNKTVFVNDGDEQTWDIANPDMLMGHLGMRVKVKAIPNVKQKSLLVDEVKDLKQKQEKPKTEKKKGKRFIIF